MSEKVMENIFNISVFLYTCIPPILVCIAIVMMIIGLYKKYKGQPAKKTLIIAFILFLVAIIIFVAIPTLLVFIGFLPDMVR